MSKQPTIENIAHYISELNRIYKADIRHYQKIIRVLKETRRGDEGD